MSELLPLFTLLEGDAPVEHDASALLASADRGSRMAAYAYVYANPDPVWIGELVDAVIGEDTRFGQYWGLRALRRLVEADPPALDMPTRRRLEQFAMTLVSETDGADELRRLLRDPPA